MTATAASSFKQKAHELIDQLPEGATWRDVAYQAAVRAEADEGLADIRAGRVIDGESVLRWIDSWGTGGEFQGQCSRAGDIPPVAEGEISSALRY